MQSKGASAEAVASLTRFTIGETNAFGTEKNARERLGENLGDESCAVCCMGFERGDAGPARCRPRVPRGVPRAVARGEHVLPAVQDRDRSGGGGGGVKNVALLTRLRETKTLHRHSLLAAGCSGLSTNALVSSGPTRALRPRSRRTSHRPTTTRAPDFSKSHPKSPPPLSPWRRAAARAPRASVVGESEDAISYAFPWVFSDFTPTAGSFETTAPITETFVRRASASPRAARTKRRRSRNVAGADADDAGFFSSTRGSFLVKILRA